MAGILVQAGDKRYVGASSHLLIHEASYGNRGKISEMRDEAGFVDSLNNRAYEILAERSTLTKEEIKEKADRKNWVSFSQRIC